MFQDASRSILDGTDTIGLRYRLWRVAWQIWQDYPLAGVGIGKFSEFSLLYGFISSYQNLGAHSIYFTLLAENGLVGLIFYLGLMISALGQLFHVARSNHGEWSSLARTWLFILLLVLIGGITKNDQYDKFPWLIPGLALAINRASYREQSKSVLPTSLLPNRPTHKTMKQNELSRS
jgi:O-antigen ligase